MNKSTKSLIVVGLVIILGIGLFYITREDTSEVSIQTTPTNETEMPTASTDTPASEQIDSETISISEVAQHNSENDCWTIINDKVYDITSYVPRHPGGDEILLACGQDGTSLFTSRTSNDGEEIGSGTPHSSNASNQLGQFYIGDLTN